MAVIMHNAVYICSHSSAGIHIYVGRSRSVEKIYISIVDLFLLMLIHMHNSDINRGV